jgi:hypothetical protein
MRLVRLTIVAALAASLAACVRYHQEVAALRMPRPAHEPAELAAYAKPDPDFPSVGGDIMKGASPTATDQASGDETPSPPASQAGGATTP